MADFSLYVSDAIVGVALLVDKLNKIPGVGSQNVVSRGSFAMFPSLASLGILKKGLDYVSKTGAEYRAMTTPVTQGYLGSMPVGIYPSSAELAKQRQMEKERLNLEKERASLAKKSTLEAKKTAALAKASKTIDLERIGMTAALRNQVSETDRLSLNLQLALLDKNDAQATKLAGQLDAAVKRQNELAALLLATPKAPNPYENWKIPDDVQAWTAASLGVSVSSLGTTPVPILSTFSDAEMELAMAVNAGQAAEAKLINVQVYLDNLEVGNAVRDASIN